VESFVIFGAGGQDGLILSRRLSLLGENVTCVVGSDQSRHTVERYAPGARVVVGDIRDEHDVRETLAAVKPTRVFNFAAVSSVALSWSHPGNSLDVNLVGVANILGALRSTGVEDVRFFQSSSSEVFDKSPSPLNEVSPRQPRSPYAIGKNAADQLVAQFREHEGLFATTGIFFSHESPLRTTAFLSRHVSRAVAEIAAGARDRIQLGNIDAVRDWGYAPDYVTAAELAMSAPTPADYVISSGEPHSVRDILDVAFTAVGISEWEHRVEIDPTRLRPADDSIAVGDSTKIRRELGWRPTLAFTEIITRMVEHDVKQVTAGVKSIWSE